MKKAMSNYFKLRIKIYENGVDFVFKVPFLENEKSFIHYGNIDEYGYILWKPCEKTIIHPFDEIENKFNTKLHQNIKEYFNCYWFENIDGFIKEYYITLTPVKPYYELVEFINRLENYKKYFDNNLKFIPIGIDGNGFNVVVNNNNGSVYLEDYESKNKIFLTENLIDLILQLKLE